MDLEFLKTAFLTLFVAIDPPGLAPIFLSLTAGMTLADRKSAAYRSVFIAFCVLLGSALVGDKLLRLLGVTIPAFRIAGGLLLFYIAAEMVFEKREERKSQTAETISRVHPDAIAAFPLAIPLMAGPGAITATILQASAAEGSWLNLLALAGIIFVIIYSCLAVFLLANPIDRMLGVTGRVVLQRLLGVLLAAMAVQTIGDGVRNFILAA